jgi:hypothetical protein
VAGEMAMLLRLLKIKFGDLPQSALERIQHADAETLLVWSEQVLTAARWEDIFRQAAHNTAPHLNDSRAI